LDDILGFAEAAQVAVGHAQQVRSQSPELSGGLFVRCGLRHRNISDRLEQPAG
jgi:hypothetical protein